MRVLEGKTVAHALHTVGTQFRGGLSMHVARCGFQRPLTADEFDRHGYDATLRPCQSCARLIERDVTA